MGFDVKTLDRARRLCTAVEADLIDSLARGNIDRRDFLRASSVLGLAPVLRRTVLSVLGMAAAPSMARTAPAGGTLRLGLITPVGGVEPVRSTDPGGIAILSIGGEYLCTCGTDFVLRPGLAESWSPNQDGTVWTFRIRKGVKFHDGRLLSAADVAASFERLADADSGSNALSAFDGYLSKTGVHKIDDTTIEFRLDAPHGQFPYLVSSDTPNTIILPADYHGGYERAQIGTGPFRLESFSPDESATFVRNSDYWGARALPEKLEVMFFADGKSQLDALLHGKIDVLAQLPTTLTASIPADTATQIIRIQSTAHNQVHMRNDLDPFKDPRVRRALALSLDRPGMVQALHAGRAQLGNDSPFAPSYPSTDTTVAQRARNLAEARQLLDGAGLKSGLASTLTSQKFQDIPSFAAAIQAAASEIGGKLSIDALEQTAFFADGVFGKSPWLDSAMGITDYAHRAIPHLHLRAPLTSEGAWNAARYKSPAYDQQVTAYVAALDLDGQRKAAGIIQRTLLDETPVIFAYFTDALAATRKGLDGAQFSPLGQVWLAGASLTG